MTSIAHSANGTIPLTQKLFVVLLKMKFTRYQLDWSNMVITGIRKFGYTKTESKCPLVVRIYI